MPYRKYDNAFPTVLRYVGLAIAILNTFALIIGAFLGKGTEFVSVLSPVYIAATGMIGWKGVKKAAENNGEG